MDALLNRVITNWKTTAGGVLTVAGIVLAALVQSGGTTQHWVLVATAIVGGLTAALAKDK